MSAAVPFVRAAGRPFDAGFRHGAELGPALRAFLADDLCRIGRLGTGPVTLGDLAATLAEYDAAITTAAPALSAEIDGLAAGAGISRAEAVLLQVRREIIGFQRIRAHGDCTTYASLSAGPGGQPVLAQTVDLNGNLDDQVSVLDISLAGSPRRVLLLSFGGLLGYLGINSDGLAIGLNLVLGGTWQPGLPPYLAIRHLLDQAGSVAETLAILEHLPLASSRSLTLCDPGTVACAEIIDSQVRLVSAADLDPSGVTPAPAPAQVPGGGEPAGYMVHTNHFLHQDFTGRDELNVFARNSSALRLKAGRAGLADLTAAGGADPEEHFALLAQPPVCVADTGDIRREKTVAAVVMLPGRGELHVRPGDPSRTSTQVFRLPVRDPS